MSLRRSKAIDHWRHGDRYERRQAGHAGSIPEPSGGDDGSRISNMRSRRSAVPAYPRSALVISLPSTEEAGQRPRRSANVLMNWPERAKTPLPSGEVVAFSSAQFCARRLTVYPFSSRMPLRSPFGISTAKEVFIADCFSLFNIIPIYKVFS